MLTCVYSTCLVNHFGRFTFKHLDFPHEGADKLTLSCHLSAFRTCPTYYETSKIEHNQLRDNFFNLKTFLAIGKKWK